MNEWIAAEVKALLRADEPAVLRAVADYIAASYTPEQEARQEVRLAIEKWLGGDDGRG